VTRAEFLFGYGVYHRGDGWETDDDEEWFYDDVRLVTEEEIAAEGLF
jgi:hypothetical protein